MERFTSAVTVTSSAPNQFTVHATGGVRFLVNTNATVGIELLPGANAWSNLSDRNYKENLTQIDEKQILDRLSQVPVTEWNLISQDPSIRHIGPMAQDFYSAVGVGGNDRYISTSDADGVAFAAIQGLYKMLQEERQQISKILTEKDRRISELEFRIKQLEKSKNNP